MFNYSELSETRTRNTFLNRVNTLNVTFSNGLFKELLLPQKLLQSMPKVLEN